MPENVLEAAGGSWNTQRYLALLSPTRERVKTLIAGEVYGSDGPFDRPQRYIRTNFFAKASAWLSENVEASGWLSYLNSNWFASGQIPTRALRSGLIDRFGSIDNSEGGNTQRFSGNADLRWNLSDKETVRVHGYGQYYQLDLFSNFTFFLNDPVNGDEIEQSDRSRKVFGLDSSYERRDTPFGIPVKSTAGVQFRSDRMRVVLPNVQDRHLLARTEDSDIVETSYSPYVKFDAVSRSWLRIVTGARGDVFNFHVRNNLPGVPDQPDGSATRAIPSAKFNAILGPWAQTEFFGNFGTGFHSNDARAVVQEETLPALAQATGWSSACARRSSRRWRRRSPTGGSTCRASWSSAATRAQPSRAEPPSATGSSSRSRSGRWTG